MSTMGLKIDIKIVCSQLLDWSRQEGWLRKNIFIFNFKNLTNFWFTNKFFENVWTHSGVPNLISFIWVGVLKKQGER